MVVGLLMLGGGVAAGAFGSLLGLGGGVLIVPLLTLGFGLPLREAVGVSLICVIMTSSAAAGVFLERHVANLRLGMTLELFTATGALIGGSVAFLLDERLLAFLFAVLLLYVAVTMARAGTPEPVLDPDDDPPDGELAGRRCVPGGARSRPPTRRRSWKASPARAIACAISAAASSSRRAPGSPRPCSGSAAGSSRCR